MADERISIGIDVDASKLHSEIQRLQLASQSFVQRQTNTITNDILSTPYMASAIFGGGTSHVRGGNYLDPNVAFKQHLTQHMLGGFVGANSPFAPGVRGMYNEPLLYPSFTPTDYNYPQGFLRGSPVFMSDYHKQSWGKFFHETGHLAGHVGLHALGIHIPPHGQYRYDLPVYSTFQKEADEFSKALMKPIGAAESVVRFGGSVLGGYGAATSMVSLAGLIPGVGSLVSKLPRFLNPGLIPSLGLMGVELGLAELHRGMQVSREYMDIGQYMRDSSAPFIRSNRLSGGLSFEQSAQFQEKLGRSVAKDMWLSRSDYSDIIKLSNDAGYIQMFNSVDQISTAVDNIAGNVKALYQLGTKIKNTLETTKILSSIGIDLSQDATRNAALLSNISTAAFQAGKPVETLIQNLRSAGQMGLQQNLSMTTGVGAYTTSAGLTGELFRTGNLNMSTVALMGGKDNMEQNLMNVFMKMMRTPIGNITGMLMTQNYLRTGRIEGQGSFNNFLNKMHTLASPEEYAKMQFLSPFITDEISKKDPSALIMNATNVYMDAYGQVLNPGGKMDPYLLAMALQKQGFTPEEVRTFLLNLKNAPEIAKNTRQSVHQQMVRTQLENARKRFGISSFFSQEGRQQIRERIFDPIYSDISGSLTRLQGKLSDWYMQKMLDWYAGGTTVYNNDIDASNKIRNITDQITNNVDIVEARRNLQNMAYKKEFSKLRYTQMYSDVSDLNMEQIQSNIPMTGATVTFGGMAVGSGLNLIGRGVQALTELPFLQAAEGARWYTRAGKFAGRVGIGLTGGAIRAAGALTRLATGPVGWGIQLADTASQLWQLGRAMWDRSYGFAETTHFGFGQNKTVFSELLQKAQGEIDEQKRGETSWLRRAMHVYSGNKDFILNDEEKLKEIAQQAAQLEDVYRIIAQSDRTRSPDLTVSSAQSAMQFLNATDATRKLFKTKEDIEKLKYSKLSAADREVLQYTKIFEETKRYANFLVKGDEKEKSDYNTAEALGPVARSLFAKLANAEHISEDKRKRYKEIVQNTRNMSDEQMLAYLTPEEVKMLGTSLQGTELSKKIKNINTSSSTLQVVKELDKKLDPIKRLVGSNNVSYEDLEKYYAISYRDAQDNSTREAIRKSYERITGKEFSETIVDNISEQDEQKIKSGVKKGWFGSESFTDPNMTKQEFDSLLAAKSYTLDIQHADQFKKILDQTSLKDGGNFTEVKGDIVNLIDKVLSKKDVDDKDLKSGFKGMSRLRDTNMQQLGETGMSLMKFLENKDKKNLESFERNLRGFLSPHYKDPEELNKKLKQMVEMAERGDKQALVSGLMAYAGASSMAQSTYIAGGKADGYITPEMMEEFAKGAASQQQAANRLLEVAEKLDLSKLEFGMFGGKEKMKEIANEIGTAIADTLLKNEKFVKALTT